MSDFEREERYIVIKRKNISKKFEEYLRCELMINEIPTVECVVVESDWTCYKDVWWLVERESIAQDYLARRKASGAKKIQRK